MVTGRLPTFARAGTRIDVFRMEIEIAVRDGQKVRHVREIEGATRRLAEQRLAVGKRHERLWRGLARKRPQARTRATGENQRNQLKSNHRHEEKNGENREETPSL